MSKVANSAYLIATNAAATVVQFISVPLLLEWIGKPAYSVYLYIAVVAVYISVVCPSYYAAGQKRITEKFAEGNNEGAWQVQQTQLGLGLLSGVVGIPVFVLFGLYAPLISASVDRVTLLAMFGLAGVTFAANLVNTSLVSVLAAREMFRSVAIRQSIELLASSTASLLLAWLFRSPIAVVAGATLGTLVGFAYNVTTLKLSFPGFRLRPRLHGPTIKDLTGIFLRGWPHSIILTVSGSVDRLLLPASGRPLTIVADYTIPYRLPESLCKFVAPAMATVVPELTRLNATEPRRFALKLSRYGLQGMLVSSAFILVPSGFGEPFLRLWLGNKAPVGGAAVVGLIGVYFALNYYYNMLTKGLVAQGRMHLAVPFSLFNAIATLALTVPVARAYGIVGVAGMNAGINLAQFGVFLWYTRRFVAPEFPLAAHTAKAVTLLAAGLALGGFGWWISHQAYFLAHPVLALLIALPLMAGLFFGGFVVGLAERPDLRRH